MTLFPNFAELPQGYEALITEASLPFISKFISTYFHHTFISSSLQKMKVLPLSLTKLSPVALATPPLLNLAQEDVYPHSRLFPCLTVGSSPSLYEEGLSFSHSNHFYLTLSFSLFCHFSSSLLSQTSKRIVLFSSSLPLPRHS